MKPMKFMKFLAAHKVLTVVAACAIVGVGYYAYKQKAVAKAETRYVLTTVAKDTIVTSVSGSGQVSTSDQVDLKPKVSGDVFRYDLKAGTEVKAGQALVSIDASDALKTVRDAQDSLTSAQISLEKLQEAADPLTLLQAQNALTDAQEAKTKAVADLDKEYDDGYTAVSNVFLKLPDIMSGLNDILYGTTLNGNQSNIDAYHDAALRYDKRADLYYQTASDDFKEARAAFDAGFDEYKLSSRTESQDMIGALVASSADVVGKVAKAVKSADNLIQFFDDQATLHGISVGSVTAAHLATLDTDTGLTNSEAASLLAASTALQDGKNAIVSADRSIAERQASLDKIQAPPDALDLQSAQLAVRTREEALSDARAKLADYTVRAPFDGTIAAVADLKKGDAVSPSTSLGTLITSQPIAKLSLNEVDVAKVKVDQKATLTFDVISDLSISGHVIEVDTLGATSQGVVTYGVQIAFDTTDDRIKPGMTVSAAIITDAKTDVLVVPNSAIKSGNGGSYVEEIPGASATDVDNPDGILAPNGTSRVMVTTGLASDTETEIVSGLNEGDTIVSRAITATTATTAQSRSILQAAGGARAAGGGGGGFRGGGGGGFRPGN